MIKTSAFITWSVGVLVILIASSMAQGAVGFQRDLFDCGTDLGANSQHHLFHEIGNLLVSIRSHVPFAENKDSYERIFCFALEETRETAHEFGFLAPHCGFSQGNCETLDVIFDCEKLCRATPADENTNLILSNDSIDVSGGGDTGQNANRTDLESPDDSQAQNDTTAFNSGPISSELATPSTLDTLGPDLGGANDSAPDAVIPNTASSVWVSSNSPVAYDQVEEEPSLNPEPASIVVWLVLGAIAVTVRACRPGPLGELQLGHAS